MKLKTKIILAGVVIAAIFLIVLLAKKTAVAGPYENFAKCLTEKNATMYGNVSCPACLAQKNEFKGAFNLVPYVECTENPNQCLAAGIELVPTWIFSSGEKLVGKQSLETLAEKTGCVLPQQSN